MTRLLTILLMISIPGIAPAQIIYHGFDPPVILKVYEYEGDTVKYLPIDLTGDSIDDFNFRLSYWYYFVTPHLNERFAAGVKSLNGSKVGEIQFPYPCDALLLDLYDTISGILPWDTNATVMYDLKPDITCGPLAEPQYLPVELSINGNAHYGWILLKTSTLHYGYEPYSQASLELFECAYNSVPGEGLLAGDTTTTILNSGNESKIYDGLVTIYPVPFSDHIIIESSVLFTGIALYDSYGRMIYGIINGAKKEQIDLARFPAGIYYLKLYSDEYSAIKKIIKAN